MNSSWFYNDATVFDEFLDMGARVGVPDLGLFGRVKPDFAFSNASNAGGEAFL